MHFIATPLGPVSERPGGHLERASISAPRACGSRSLGYLRGGDGSSLKLHPLRPAAGSQLPSSIFGQEKDPLLRNCFRILSFWLLKNTGLAIGQDHHWKRALRD